uniref:Uncharacterized protein n=1 Tax=Meloidogyne enterolobii TaxID=390850 RepID=A0A6V7UEM2_MELEN|nr:unnamed protein product [Meloidogyne enterolobii]
MALSQSGNTQSHVGGLDYGMYSINSGPLMLSQHFSIHLDFFNLLHNSYKSLIVRTLLL